MNPVAHTQPPPRFERADFRTSLADWYCYRDQINPAAATQPLADADFLARLWSRLGPSDPAEGAFSYVVRDRRSGLLFSAYHGSGGPAYGIQFADRDADVLPVLRDFDAWVSEAPLADCEITFGDDAGSFRIGARNGVPFAKRAADPGP